MTSNVVANTVAALPAHLQGVIADDAFEEFSGGVTSGFPVISYRGRTWRVRKGGIEEVYLNDEGEALQSIDVVMLKSNPKPSKVHYDAKFTEGDQSPPRCWSANGDVPDTGVTNPIHASCVSCPMNVWGSKITENDKKTRACSDVRRVAVAFKHHLEEVAAGVRETKDVDVLLLRIPPATLNPLKDYVDKVLKPKGIPPYVLITKIGFDTDVAYPKLTFRALRFLTEGEVGLSLELRESEDSRRILNESLENNDGEGTTAAQSDVPAAPAQAAAEASGAAPSSSPKPAKMQPVEEDMFSVPVEDIAPAPPRAAAVEQDAAQVIEATPDPVTPATPAKEQPTPPPGGEADFDAMLNSILG